MPSARGILFFFAGTILAGLSATADPQLKAESVKATVRSPIIPKTVVSDKIRLMFLAGLEGSGHHFLRGVSAAVFKANPDLPRIEYRLADKPFYLPHCMGHSASNYAKAELQAIEGMRTLAQDAAGLSGPTFYPQKHTLSYPQNWGPEKVFQYNDLRMFAKAAEMEGLDLRVVYLKRSAHDMIIANTVHRQFQRQGPHETMEKSDEEEAFLEYFRILFTDAAVLQSFLGEIDPGFIVCHDWDSLGDEGQASKIAAFISPNDEVADMVSSVLVNKVVETPHADGEDEAGVDDLTFDGAESLVSRLQDKLDSFEVLYCDPKRSV